MEQIVINDDVCWLCGHTFNQNITGQERTTHHCLAQCLKPHKQITVPVHEACHRKINEIDRVSQLNFLFKLRKETTELASKVEAYADMAQLKEDKR